MPVRSDKIHIPITRDEFLLHCEALHCEANSHSVCSQARQRSPSEIVRRPISPPVRRAHSCDPQHHDTGAMVGVAGAAETPHERIEPDSIPQPIRSGSAARLATPSFRGGSCNTVQSTAA
jgi:hypothetical protein